MYITISRQYFRSLTILTLSLFCFSVQGKGAHSSEAATGVSIDTLQKISMMFMISHGDENLIDIKSHPVFRTNKTQFAFATYAELPEGLLLDDSGLVTWSPTAEQFNSLQNTPLILSFLAQNIDRDVIIGEIRIVAHGELIQQPDTSTELLPTEDVTVMTVADAPLPIEASEEAHVEPLVILLPEQKNYNKRNEGEEFSFDLKSTGGRGEIKFELLGPAFLMENLDRYGSFIWTPDFDFVSSKEYIKSVQLKIKAFDNSGDVAYQTVQLFVQHINRPPVVHELPTFYIQFNSKNTYQLGKQGFVFDPDEDSIIFNPVLKELPQGVALNKNGFISWTPSRGQFNALAAKAIYLSFTVEDYPYGLKTIGEVRLEVSQADLPPEITMMPNKNNFDLKENEELQLSFFITDPNGEDDILSFGFVTENSSIKDNALQRKENWQYEFTWTPGFDFIKETGQKNEFDISFFAIDKESNRNEKNIVVTVEDTENLVEKDRLYYDQYRTVLERAYDLITQLTEKEKELDKKYKQSKKGKKTGPSPQHLWAPLRVYRLCFL
ncbi:MAG: hypothetical protein HC819_11135 [Cyclobacteriaceae bacterium]|nr:hypothetical protein [Cyclobacteriaceae bacterium]